MNKTYGQFLHDMVTNAKPAASTDRAKLEAGLATINEQLKRPMSNVERLMLCEDRASIRKALEALKG